MLPFKILLRAILALSLFSIVATITHHRSHRHRRNRNNRAVTFGRSLRKDFYFDKDYINLNHGAFGTYPKYVGNIFHKYQAESEERPDLWMRRTVKEGLIKVQTLIGDLVKADPKDIVIVPNTTSAMNAILRNLIFEFGSRILHFSTVFSAVKSLIEYVVDNSGGNVTTLSFPVQYPITQERLLSNFEKFLRDNDNKKQPIKIAVIDHVSSVPSVIVPIEKIIPILRKRNIMVLIDGAHALGQVPIDISKLKPDYYVSNCHKWLYAARGCAMMYVRNDHQRMIHPHNIAFNYAKPTKFQDEFYWTGTTDYTPFMTVMPAIDYRKQLGGEAKIQDYTHNLAVNGGKRAADILKTEVLHHKNQIASMVDVRLPLTEAAASSAYLSADLFYDVLFKRYNLFAVTFKHGGKWWIRCSAQIYNDLSDFEAVAKAYKEISMEINKNISVGGRAEARALGEEVVFEGLSLPY